jgi:D-alanyl-D-alanine dipeptidase
MSENSVFAKYGLESAPFSADLFADEFGARLANGGLADVALQLESAAAHSVFLARPLSTTEKRHINEIESLKLASQAAAFADRAKTSHMQESFHNLTNLRLIAAARCLPLTFTNIPYHQACGDWAGKQKLMWVREPIADQLVSLAGQLAAADFGLHIHDAFRPPGVQEGLFQRRYDMTRKDHPEWDHEQVLLETRSKTAFSPRVASHKGGAALDVMLVDLRSSQSVDIGHEYSEGGAVVALDSPYVTQSQWMARHLLAAAAKGSGFALFPYEDWHICSGDNTAAATAAGPQVPSSLYGPIKEFDPVTGAITSVYDEDELDETFPILNQV